MKTQVLLATFLSFAASFASASVTESDWCTVTAPDSFHPGVAFEIQVTMKKDIPAGENLSCFLHWMKADGYGGFLSWAPPQTPKAGETAVFRHTATIDSAKHAGFASIWATAYTAPDSDYKKISQQVKNIPRILPSDVAEAKAAAAAAEAAKPKLVCTPDKLPLAYAVGETITLSVSAAANGAPAAGKLTWKISHDQSAPENGSAVVGADGKAVVTTVQPVPGFVKIDLVFQPADGGKELKKTVGFAVAPEALKPAVEEPADFDAVWEKALAALAEVPIEMTVVGEKTPAPKAGFKCLDIRIKCAGGKDVSGYLKMPVDAAPKSLRAQLTLHGYGVGGADAPSWSFQPGMVTFDINAHGIDNGQPPEYYKNLSNTTLKNYGFNDAENASFETCYFYGMMLRAIRAAQFLATLPEWDGKNLEVYGGSQGGLQAVTVAAHVPEVTVCRAEKPWCADLASYTVGRMNGWRPKYAEGMKYFDIVYQARRVKCPVELTAGLIDYVCPPGSVMTVYNAVPGKARIIFQQSCGHERFGDWKFDQEFKKP